MQKYVDETNRVKGTKHAPGAHRNDKKSLLRNAEAWKRRVKFDVLYPTAANENPKSIA